MSDDYWIEEGLSLECWFGGRPLLFVGVLDLQIAARPDTGSKKWGGLFLILISWAFLLLFSQRVFINGFCHLTKELLVSDVSCMKDVMMT